MVKRRANGCKRAREIRLVLFKRGEERIGIPGTARCLWRQICDVVLHEFIGKRQDIFGTGATAVNQNCGGAGARERRARSGNFHHTVSCSGGSFASSSARRASRNGGSF